MRVVPPIEITDARLLSTNVPEPDASAGEAVWSSGATYAKGDLVISTTTHRTYESLQDGNLNKVLTNAAYWLDVGPTNRYAMFDLYRNTGSLKAANITTVIKPGRRVDSLALLGLQADSVTITATSGGVTVYSKTIPLAIRSTSGWYSYFFGDFTFRNSAAVFDIPPYTDLEITVSIDRATGSVVCGGLVVGQSVYIGETIIGAESDALNFSVIERDAFGQATLIPRRTIPKTTQQVRALKGNVNRIRETRDLLNAVPALWSWIDDQEDNYFDSGLILGVYRRLTINMDVPEYALVTLELEEI